MAYGLTCVYYIAEAGEVDRDSVLPGETILQHQHTDTVLVWVMLACFKLGI